MATTTQRSSSTGAPRRPANESEDLRSLVSRLSDQARGWIQQEISLAKAELLQAAKDTIRGATRGAIGVGLLALAAVLLLFAIVGAVALGLHLAGLTYPVAIVVSLLLLGTGVGIAGWLLFRKAKQQLSTDNLAPQKTVDTLIETKDWAKSIIQ